MADILDDLIDLHKQATVERSHFYVAKTAERAIDEIKLLRMERATWQIAYETACKIKSQVR